MACFPEYTLGEKVDEGQLADVFTQLMISRSPVDIRYDCEGIISMCSTSTLKTG